MVITPLHAACTSGRLDVAEELLHAGVDAKAQDKLSTTAFELLRAHGSHLKFLDRMLEGMRFHGRLPKVGLREGGRVGWSWL